MKLYYWCPFFSNIATEKAVINSIVALNKFSKKKINPYLLDVIGEWDNQKFNLLDKKIEKHDLLNFKLIKYLPKFGFLKSRFSYIIVFFFSIFRLHKFLKNQKPDYLIVHLMTFIPLTLLLFFNYKKKIILRISGYPKLNFLRKFFWKIVSKKLYKIFTPTEITKKMLIKNGVFREDQIFLLRDPIISIKNLNTLKTKKIDDNFEFENYILSIGRLTKQKNFQFLIKAYAFVKQEITNLPKLLIIGEGEERNYLTKKIRENKLEKDVFLLGYKNNIFQYLNKSLFFILSSDWEDPGFVLVEAAASNKLILSSDVLSGPKEFLRNKSSGFLFEKENFKDFKNKIQHILNDTNSKEIYFKRINAKKNSRSYTIFHHYKELSKLL